MSIEEFWMEKRGAKFKQIFLHIYEMYNSLQIHVHYIFTAN